MKLQKSLKNDPKIAQEAFWNFKQYFLSNFLHFPNLAIMEREARHGESCKHVKKGKSRESSKKSKSQTATRRSSN